MRKFSEKINESLDDDNKIKRLPYINESEWNDIIDPFINLISNKKEIFKKETINKLFDLVKNIQNDYKEYYISEIDDKTPESFFKLFKIDGDPKDIKNCLLPFFDTSKNHLEQMNFDNGVYSVVFTNSYKSIADLIEDVTDVKMKLEGMFSFNYKIFISLVSGSIEINIDSKNIENAIKDNWKDSWNRKYNEIDILRGIGVYIYNENTVILDNKIKNPIR